MVHQRGRQSPTLYRNTHHGADAIGRNEPPARLKKVLLVKCSKLREIRNTKTSEADGTEDKKGPYGLIEPDKNRNWELWTAY